MRRLFGILLAVCPGLALACNPETTAPQVGTGASLEIRDGAHLGNQHFFFLPPVLPMPSYSGVANGNMAPAVSICEWNLFNGKCGAMIAEFGTGGSGSETVTYDVMGQKYQVNWKTDQCLTGACTLDPAKTYRIRVLVGAVELGHADVDVVSTGSQLKNVQTSEYIGLVDGRTLPIKFRIETGAVTVLAPGGSAPIGASGGSVTSTDGSVALVFPDGALAGNTNISVSPISDPPAGTGAWAPVVDLGPNGTTFANPVTLSIEYQPENLPEGVPPTALVLMAFDGAGWVQVPGSTIDSVDNTVSAPISHFSTYSVGIWPNYVNGIVQNTIRVGQMTAVSGGVWSYQVVPIQYCYWIRTGWLSRAQVCTTYTGTYSYSVPRVAVYWNSSAPSIGSVLPGPTYTDANGIATSPPVTGRLPGNTDLRAYAEGTVSGPMPLTVLGVLGLLPHAATNVAGWTVGEQVTQSVAIPIALSVSLLNRNGFLTVGEPGTGNYTYGGQTGTYLIPAGNTAKQLSIFGLSGVGTDTLIASAAGFVPDTAVITLVKGKFLLTGWPTALTFGDSTALTLTVADSGGALGNLAYPIDVTLTPGAGLVFTSGGTVITTLPVPQRTSATFYVKATGSGTRTVLISHRDYGDYANSVTVGAPPPLVFNVFGTGTDPFRKFGFNQGTGMFIIIPTALATPLTVSLSHSNQSVASTNSTATIAAGNRSEGVTLGAGTVAGRDTIIGRAPGYSPDTLVIETGPGRTFVVDWPASLAYGDSAAIRIRPMNQDSTVIDNAWFTSFALSSNGKLSFSRNSVPITSITVQDGTSSSPVFYVKAIAAGAATMTVTNSWYITGPYSVTVPPAVATGLIAVLSTRFGGNRLVLMNADGTGAHLATPFEPLDDQPVPDLSPDRNTVLFAHGSQVWKADVATGAVTQLTFSFEGSYTRYAKWSPDGQKIAFNSLRDGNHSIYTMNPDGSGVQQVTHDPEDEGHPTWSPDGRRIAFIGIRGGQQQIYVVDIATGVERQVTFDPGIHGVPRWAPTGSLLAYVNNGSNAIWVVDVDSGSPPVQVTPTGGAAGDGPGWSPDGRHIIFGSNLISGHSQLWMVDADGTNLHLFVPTPFNDGWPSWR